MSMWVLILTLIVMELVGRKLLNGEVGPPCSLVGPDMVSIILTYVGTLCIYIYNACCPAIASGGEHRITFACSEVAQLFNWYIVGREEGCWALKGADVARGVRGADER